MNNEIINAYTKCYLIGPIEKVQSGDFGANWRKDIRQKLSLRVDMMGKNIYVFDPCETEKEKLGMSAKDYHQEYKKWVKENNYVAIINSINLIWKGKHYIEKVGTAKARLITILGDCDYVLNSNFLICRMEKGDSPCGTFGEAYEAYKHHIPIYVLQTMALDEYPATFIGWVYASGGFFFKTSEDLLDYIDNLYHLHKI